MQITITAATIILTDPAWKHKIVLSNTPGSSYVLEPTVNPPVYTRGNTGAWCMATQLRN